MSSSNIIHTCIYIKKDIHKHDSIYIIYIEIKAIEHYMTFDSKTKNPSFIHFVLTKKTSLGMLRVLSKINILFEIYFVCEKYLTLNTSIVQNELNYDLLKREIRNKYIYIFLNSLRLLLAGIILCL